MKLGLHIICKDEVEEIKRILMNYHEFFDEIVIAVDDKFSLLKKMVENFNKGNGKVKLLKYDWRDDFAHKRNFVVENTTSDYYFRLDCDDEIVNPQAVREAAEHAHKNDISIVYCFYDYSKDEWGNVNAGHYRETIIKNTKNLYWNKPVHENILPKSRDNFQITFNDQIKINHRMNQEHAERSAERNLKILITEYNKHKENTDPRTIAYLGRMFFTLGDNEKAVYFLQKHIEKSGWDEDRYVSWNMMAEIFKQRRDYAKAIASCFEAIQERPDWPDAYFKLHDIYFDQHKWTKAIEWGRMGFERPKPKTFMLLDPSSYTWRPMLSMAFCYLQISEFIKAKQLFDRVEKMVPSLEWVKKNKGLFEQAYYHKKFIDQFLYIFNFVKEKDEKLSVKLLECVPKELQEHEIIINLKNQYLPPKTWPKKSVVILCGHTQEVWSPKSIKTGIGGSEEAVIQMSRGWQKRGYQVTVFNNCGENEGNYDGVQYLNWYKFNTRDVFDILIVWRVNLFLLGFKARRRILWLHDLPFPDQYPENCCNYLDKIVVLSKYHKTLLPDTVDKQKVYVSTNGLVTEDFENLEGSQRNPHRMIWASSYDRGLEYILKLWPKIREEVPDAELHCYYGWQVFDSLALQGARDPNEKLRVQKLMSQPGIQEHGRIGHKELVKEYAKSSVFAYPCTYAGEINCIAITKAKACGLYTVTNDFAVLPERSPDAVVKGDIKTVRTQESFKNAIVKGLLNPKTPEINWNYAAFMSWDKIADRWAKDIF